MRLHDLIFSAKPGRRWQRHLVFWLTWWLYFAFCDYLNQLPVAETSMNPYYANVGPLPLLKTFLLMVVYAMACYPILYILLPLIVKRNWLKATLLFLTVICITYALTYFLFRAAFPYLDTYFKVSSNSPAGFRLWPVINFAFIAPIKIIASAVAIIFVKNWWLKQKESERLEREKLNAELMLLKAQVHPDFLRNTLNNIYSHALSSSPRTPGMLLKLSDLLSYMIYECDKPLVSLDKEIEMMKEYMLLEKIRHNEEPEIEVSVRGNPFGKQIAPFLLLPFIENSFNYCDQMAEQSWINMDIGVENEILSMKLTNGFSAASTDISSKGLEAAKKRLNFLYPGRHQLKINAEHEMLIVLLQIELGNVPALKIEAEAGFPAVRNDWSREMV